MYCAPQSDAVRTVLQEIATERNAPILFTDITKDQITEEKPGRMAFTHVLSTGERISLTTVMAGTYQVKNASLAAEAAFAMLGGQMKGTIALKDTQRIVQQSTEEVCEIIKRGIFQTLWPGSLCREPEHKIRL